MNNLAINCAALGKHDEALQLREETLKRSQAKLGPDHLNTLRNMSNLAKSYASLGRHAEALQLRKQTLERRQAQLGPDHPETLWSTYYVASSLLQLDRGAEALPLLDDFLQRVRGKSTPLDLISEALYLRLGYFAKRKDTAGCRATAELWEKQQRTDADSLYDAACMRAVTAGVLGASDKTAADAEAERAMAWLKQAVSAGYKNAAHMKQDSDLDALRSRPDFRQLLASLEADSANKKE